MAFDCQELKGLFTYLLPASVEFSVKQAGERGSNAGVFQISKCIAETTRFTQRNLQCPVPVFDDIFFMFVVSSALGYYS